MGFMRIGRLIISCLILEGIFFFSFSSSLWAKRMKDEITGGFRFVSPGLSGQKRWKVEGDKAKFISQKIIEVTPARAVVYNGTTPEYFIKADWARMNKENKNIWTEGKVEIIRGNSKITGKGLNWETDKKQVSILSDVKMTLSMNESKQWQMMR